MERMKELHFAGFYAQQCLCFGGRVATLLAMRVSAWQELSCCCFIYIVVFASEETKYTITEVVMKYYYVIKFQVCKHNSCFS